MAESQHGVHAEGHHAGADSVTDVAQHQRTFDVVHPFLGLRLRRGRGRPDLPRHLQHLTAGDRLPACARPSRPDGRGSLAGCEVYRPADFDDIARARYVSPEPPSVTLLSMVNSGPGRSAHVGLLINGSEQVLYDPAGTFTHPDLPRRGDVHYGMTPRYVDYYERYHARFDYFVEAQRLPVSRAQADQMLANAKAHGQSMKMTCALDVGRRAEAGSQLPGRSGQLFPRGAAGQLRRATGRANELRLRIGRGKERRMGDSPRRDRRGRRQVRPHRRMSAILPRSPRPPDGERVSLGDMVDAFDARAFAPLIVLFAAPNVLPVALPGISAVLGVPLILLTAS